LVAVRQAIFLQVTENAISLNRLLKYPTRERGTLR